MTHVRKLTTSSLAIAVYIAVVYITQAISFGQYQIRLATGLYSMAYQLPFLCLPLGIANMLSNILFSGDIVNGLFGFVAGILTTASICLLKRVTSKKYLLVIPIAIIPSLIIPIWLSISLSIPYHFLVVSLLVGQTISAYTSGLLVLYLMERLVQSFVM